MYLEKICTVKILRMNKRVKRTVVLRILGVTAQGAIIKANMNNGK